MHLDAPLGFVVSRHMIELCQIEISVELAINSRQEILVEGGCYAGVIVVCERERWDRLFEVGGQEERVSLAQRRPDLAQDLIARRTVEIPDRASQEKHQQLFAFAALRGHLAKSIEIRALESHDTYEVDTAKLELTAKQRAAGNIDRIVVHALPPRERLQQPPRLLPAAAAELRHHHGTGHPLDDVRSVPLEQPHSRAAQSVLR